MAKFIVVRRRGSGKDVAVPIDAIKSVAEQHDYTVIYRNDGFINVSTWESVREIVEKIKASEES